MNLSQLHEADAQAMELYRALGRDEAYRKARDNAAYYETYGGTDLADNQAFWSAVADALLKFH
jgi:hypothetical protein